MSAERAFVSRDVLLIVGLNLVPLGGVLLWGWKAFDLIFLYWMENVIIGAFSVLRMLARPYTHAVDLAFPLFVAPFFVMHYGGFCWGHGQFVLSMFTDNGFSSMSLVDSSLAALQATPMLVAALGLVALQAFDWARDTWKHGFGADGLVDLMVAPYRRIVVLHLTILTGGFVITLLGEPQVGLVALVAIKTTSDVWHWRKENEQGTAGESEFELTETHLQEMKEKFAEPKVTVNGKDKHFESFAELKRSGEFRLMQSVLRLMGARKELKVIHAYINMKIAEEGNA